MKSHEYHFGRTDLIRLAGPLIVPVAIFAAILRLGALSGILPHPWPALDVDHTILTHQAQASRMPSRAEVLLIGDSSCLMDASGAKLDELYGLRHLFLNLGSSMYVGLNGYTAMLSRFTSANPDRLRLVVVLLHPEMLRGVAPVSQDLVFISDYYSGEDYRDSESVQGQVSGFFGLDIFRDRFWSRLPLPLPKEYGRYYGFNLNLYQFMDQQQGSAVDPHHFVARPGQGNAEFRFSPSLAPGLQALSAAIPQNSKVAIGITPIPESFAPPGYRSRWLGIYAQWQQSMSSDVVLTNLPPTLPDSDFASTTHLNQHGSLHFTEALAKCLQPYLDP